MKNSIRIEIRLVIFLFFFGFCLSPDTRSIIADYNTAYGIIKDVVTGKPAVLEFYPSRPGYFVKYKEVDGRYQANYLSYELELSTSRSGRL